MEAIFKPLYSNTSKGLHQDVNDSLTCHENLGLILKR